MKRSTRLILSASVAIALSNVSTAIAGECVFTGESEHETFNFGARLSNRPLTIPADTPNGTIVYQETMPSAHQSWECYQTSRYGILLNPKFGSASGLVSTFPLGNSGLSYRIWLSAVNRYERGPRLALGANGYTLVGGNLNLEIIKTGKLASKVNIDAGALGTLQADDYLILKTFNLINPIILNAASCETPSVPVAMGNDYQLQEFEAIGARTRTVRFDIALNQCNASINKVTYSLKANTPIIDATKGIVALNAGSTAKGIGLQVMNEAGQPIAFNTSYPFDAFTSTGLNFKIPLSAAYYRLGAGNVEAGSANTEVTFIVKYL